jgi:hypothetical protein
MRDYLSIGIHNIRSTRKGTVTREGKPHHEKNKTYEEEQDGLKKHTIKRDEWRTLEGRSKEEQLRKIINKNRVLIFYTQTQN